MITRSYGILVYIFYSDLPDVHEEVIHEESHEQKSIRISAANNVVELKAI